MKILLINNDKGWSGGQEHLKDLAGQLVTFGVEIHFVVRQGSPSAERYRALGYRVHPLPKHGLGDLLALARLVKLLRRERFDVISVNREHDLSLTVLAWHLAFPLRRQGKLLMSYHTATSRRQLLLGSADAIICISEHVQQKLLLGNPAAADRTRVVYYGIRLEPPPPPEKFMVDRPRRFFTGTGFPLIGMVGELWKNQIELVEAIPHLQRAYPGIKVAFIGDHSDLALFQPLQTRIRELGVEEAVIFTGRVPRVRIPDIFFDLDVSVTTHRNEGYGIVHLESLAAGTPVVCFNEGGQVDLLREDSVALLVDGGVPEFAAATVRLLQDDAERFAMGQRGYRLVARRYSLPAMGERYLQFYRELCGR